MPCLLVALALAVPRLVCVLLFLLTDWFRGAVQPPVLGILAFLFLPTTLLWYAAVQHWFGGVWGPWQIAGVVLAVLLDVGPLRRRRE
jgi:hypothetical protein